MRTWVALLRGINVGTSNRLPMADLRALCEGMGWKDVRTYIASGNVVFRAELGADALGTKLHEALPFDVPVLVLSADSLKERLAHCPFPASFGKNAHGFFCLDAPDVDSDALALYQSNEEMVVKGHTIWLHTPDGFSKSKLAERFDRVVTGTTYTARNLNTIHKLIDMCG